MGRPGVVPDRVVSDGGDTAHRAASRPATAEILRIEAWDISASNSLGVRARIYGVDVKALGAGGDGVIVEPALRAGVVWTVVGIIVADVSAVDPRMIYNLATEPGRHRSVCIGSGQSHFAQDDTGIRGTA